MSELRLAPPPPIDRLLVLGAVPSLPAPAQARLVEEAARYADWERLPATAEAHGIAPLVHQKIKQLGLPAPPEIVAALAGLAARHQHAARIRQKAIAELASACARADLPLLVLKGGALAHTVYERPGLRPMRDLDVLVDRDDLSRAGALFAELGYAADDEAGWASNVVHMHHQAERVRVLDGLRLTVEVHYRIGVPALGTERDLGAFWPHRQAFPLDGASVQVLSPAAMLVHVYHHGFCTPLRWPDRLRLVSFADVHALVEREHARLDWVALRKRWPRMLDGLAWMHALVPWSEAVQARLPFVPTDDARELSDYRGWPREQWADRPGQRLAHLRDTGSPPRFWLRLRQGGAPGALGTAGAWLRHVWEVVS